jgi:hypothetical protein
MAISGCPQGTNVRTEPQRAEQLLIDEGNHHFGGRSSPPGRKSRGLTQNLVGLLQLADLAFEFLEANTSLLFS